MANLVHFTVSEEGGLLISKSPDNQRRSGLCYFQMLSQCRLLYKLRPEDTDETTSFQNSHEFQRTEGTFQRGCFNLRFSGPVRRAFPIGSVARWPTVCIHETGSRQQPGWHSPTCVLKAIGSEGHVSQGEPPKCCVKCLTPREPGSSRQATLKLPASLAPAAPLGQFFSFFYARFTAKGQARPWAPGGVKSSKKQGANGRVIF